MLVSRIALLATAVAAGIVRRDATQILEDLKILESDNRKLEVAALNHDSTTASAIPVLKAFKQLDDDIKKATSDAGAIGQISEADAQSIIDYLTKTLEPAFAGTICVFHQKKPVIDTTVGWTRVYHDQFNILFSDSEKFRAALQHKVPDDKYDDFFNIMAEIEADFGKGVGEYNS